MEEGSYGGVLCSTVLVHQRAHRQQVGQVRDCRRVASLAGMELHGVLDRLSESLAEDGVGSMGPMLHLWTRIKRVTAGGRSACGHRVLLRSARPR